MVRPHLSQRWSPADAGGAFAAYITGNVASNLIGRLVSAAVADHLGLASNFYFFAALNLAGAVLVYYTIAQTTPMMQMGPAARSPFAAWITHLRNPRLRAAFGIGSGGRTRHHSKMLHAIGKLPCNGLSPISDGAQD